MCFWRWGEGLFGRPNKTASKPSQTVPSISARVADRVWKAEDIVAPPDAPGHERVDGKRDAAGSDNRSEQILDHTLGQAPLGDRYALFIGVETKIPPTQLLCGNKC